MSTMSMIMENAARLTADERIDMVISLLQGLKVDKAQAQAQSPEPKTKKVKKEVDPDAEPKPKRESNYFIKATALVRDILKPTIEAHNANLGPDEKKLPGTTPVRVASMLKDAGLLSDSLTPTPAQVQEVFQRFLSNPPDIKPKKGSSVASENSEPKAAKKPKVELTNEEKAAERKVRAAKIAATKAAKKNVIVNPDTNVDMPFILGGKSYLRIANSLWDAASDKWIGEFNPTSGTIDTTAKEPERVYE